MATELNPLAAPTAIAALPMYDYPELRSAHTALWRAIAARLIEAGLKDVPATLTRHLHHFDTWRHPALLLGQACEYPLAKTFASYVTVVATPRYSAAGCEGPTCRSAIIARAQDSAQELSEFRGRRCALNEVNSHSGMNALRARIAPLARTDAFFSAVKVSGSHRRSAEMVVEGAADIAALDCVSLAHFKSLYPQLTDKLKIIGWSEAAPALPFITARATPPATILTLQRALSQVFQAPDLAPVREKLLLTGLDFRHPQSFAAVLELERRAAALGYVTLL